MYSYVYMHKDNVYLCMYINVSVHIALYIQREKYAVADKDNS